MDLDSWPSLPPGYEDIDAQSSALTSQACHKLDPRFTTERSGEHWMDGHAIIVRACSHDNYSYLRPWNDCIPVTKLSIDNLPPFYVRLNDNQVGHLKRWANNNAADFPTNRLGQLWPADFVSTTGNRSTFRHSWGPAFTFDECKGREMKSDGRYAAPKYINPNLAPTFTSSGRLMRQEANPHKSTRATKRPPTEIDATENSNVVKKPCIDFESLHCEKLTHSSGPDDQTTKDVDRSRDEVIQTLAEKIDSLVREKSDMGAEIEGLKQESINASELAQRHQRTTRDLERRNRQQKRLIAAMKKSCQSQEEYLENVREACRKIKDHKARLDATKEDIRTHIEALGELTRTWEQTAPTVQSHEESTEAAFQ